MVMLPFTSDPVQNYGYAQHLGPCQILKNMKQIYFRKGILFN